MTRLKKQKLDLENRLREQEEELDDLAGQVYSHGDGVGGDGGDGMVAKVVMVMIRIWTTILCSFCYQLMV